MVSIENGAYRLTSITENPPGKLKLVFDFGSALDHPVFGKAKELSGEIRLFQNQELIPISNYFKLTKEEQKKLFDDAVARLSYMFENLDEETLKKQMFSMIILTVMCFPRLDVHSTLFEIAVGVSAGGCMADDWADDMDFFFADVKEANRILIEKLNFDWKKFMSCPEASDNNLNELCSSVPDSDKFRVMFSDFLNKLRTEFPSGIPVSMKYAFEQFGLSAQSLTLGYRADDTLALTEDMQKIIRGYDAGFGPCADFAIALQGQTVPKKIRKSLLFKLLFNGVMEFSGLINDVLGIMKDIDKGAANENHILRRVIREGISIEQSFQEALKRLQNLIYDVNIIMQRLLDAFPDEVGLHTYVQACKDYCDGETIAYVIASQINYRYGTTSLQIVPA